MTEATSSYILQVIKGQIHPLKSCLNTTFHECVMFSVGDYLEMKHCYFSLCAHFPFLIYCTCGLVTNWLHFTKLFHRERTLMYFLWFYIIHLGGASKRVVRASTFSAGFKCFFKVQRCQLSIKIQTSGRLFGQSCTVVKNIPLKMMS